MVKFARVTVLALVAVTIGQGAAFAQAIAGVVRDASGGVMPGVTVEAASPALIEKTRTAVTDGEGQYKIISLSPGHLFASPSRWSASIPCGAKGSRSPTTSPHGVNAEMKVGSDRRNDHRLGTEPAHRHAKRHAEKGAHQRTHRRASYRPHLAEPQRARPRRVGAALEHRRRRFEQRAVSDDDGPREPRGSDAARHERHAVQQHEQHGRRLQHHARDQHGHRPGDDHHDQRPVGRRRGRAA